MTYEWYRDAYGGSLPAGAFAEVMPAAPRCMRGLMGGVDVAGLDDEGLDAWSCAVCAAVDVLAEAGEGQAGGYEIGDYKVPRHVGDGVESGTAQAARSALAELAGTGLAFCGVA